MRHPVRRLVAVGSVVGELRMYVPNQPAPGGSVRADANAVQVGGCYRTIATARLLGLPTVLVGLIGDNPIGQLLRAAIARANVVLPLAPVSGEHGYTMVAVDNSGDVSRIEVAGVEATLTRQLIESVPIGAEDLVLVLGSDLVSSPVGGAIADWVADGGLGAATLVFAPGSLMLDIPDAVLDTVMRRTDILVLNQSEFALITGVTLPEERGEAAMGLLRSLAPSPMMLVRVDGQGCWLVQDGLGTWYDAPKLGNRRRVTPDCRMSAHLGIFLAELSRFDDPAEATRIATIGWAGTPGPDRPWVTVIGPTRGELDVMAAASAAEASATEAAETAAPPNLSRASERP